MAIRNRLVPAMTTPCSVEPISMAHASGTDRFTSYRGERFHEYLCHELHTQYSCLERPLCVEMWLGEHRDSDPHSDVQRCNVPYPKSNVPALHGTLSQVISWQLRPCPGGWNKYILIFKSEVHMSSNGVRCCEKY